MPPIFFYVFMRFRHETQLSSVHTDEALGGLKASFCLCNDLVKVSPILAFK